MNSNHICYVCKTRECTIDWEPGSPVSYNSTCESCFNIIACAPYCYNLECSSRICGSQTGCINYGPAITKTTAIFQCPNCKGQATRIGWSIGSGRATARRDAQAKLDGSEYAWMVDTRLESIGANYDAAHPESRAYARAYVDTARELLGV